MRIMKDTTVASRTWGDPLPQIVCSVLENLIPTRCDPSGVAFHRLTLISLEIRQMERWRHERERRRSFVL